jgi:hypothetical protein
MCFLFSQLLPVCSILSISSVRQEGPFRVWALVFHLGYEPCLRKLLIRWSYPFTPEFSCEDSCDRSMFKLPRCKSFKQIGHASVLFVVLSVEKTVCRLDALQRLVNQGSGAQIAKSWYRTVQWTRTSHRILYRVGANRNGRWAGPRTCDPGRGSQAPRMISSVRLNRSAKAMRASSRARGAPRQKCGPCPNAKCGFGSRAMSNRPGSGKAAGSRFADPITANTSAPAGTAVP